MTASLTRRTAIGAAAAALALPAVALAAEPELDALERRFGGRLGVYAVDLGNGRTIAHRADEAFAMCSTFKMMAVGAVLARVKRGEDDLARRVDYARSDLLPYAPVTRAHLDRDGVGTLTLEQLCAAAIVWSDNTAANLLLHALAGPHGVTEFARAIGDPHTRLDRDEPALNSAIPGDPRDTTTPAAMAADVRRLIFGTTLGAYAARLRAWMLDCRTAGSRIPAGLPARWRSGNKTGSGSHATTNDIAFLIPPSGAPKILTAYYTASRADEDQRDATLANVARIVSRRFG